MLKAQSPDLLQKREAILMIRYEAGKLKLFFVINLGRGLP